MFFILSFFQLAHTTIEQLIAKVLIFNDNLSIENFASVYFNFNPIMKIEPSREIMTLFVLRKLILQRRMRSHLVG